MDKTNPGSALRFRAGYAGRRIRRVFPLFATIKDSVKKSLLSARSAAVQQRRQRLGLALKFGALTGTQMRGRGIAQLLACLLAGCVTPNAEGTMLSADTALISSAGANVDEPADIIDRALKQAANLASAHGYQYFTILTADNTSTTMTVSIPGQKLNVQNMQINRAYGATNFGAPASPGGTYTTPDRMVTRIKPSLDIIIKMYRQGQIDPNVPGVWNVDVVLGRFAATREAP
jgi:hypothetical protein